MPGHAACQRSRRSLLRRHSESSSLIAAIRVLRGSTSRPARCREQCLTARRMSFLFWWILGTRPILLDRSHNSRRSSRTRRACGMSLRHWRNVWECHLRSLRSGSGILGRHLNVYWMRPDPSSALRPAHRLSDQPTTSWMRFLDCSELNDPVTGVSVRRRSGIRPYLLERPKRRRKSPEAKASN